MKCHFSPARAVHSIAPSLHHCVFLLFSALFLLFNTFCLQHSNRAHLFPLLLRRLSLSSPPFFFFTPRPINKHKGQRDRHPPVPGQRRRERDSLTWRLLAGATDSQLLMKQKRSQISRGGEEAGNREERLKALFLTAVACSRHHQEPALFLLLANSHSV